MLLGGGSHAAWRGGATFTRVRVRRTRLIRVALGILLCVLYTTAAPAGAGAADPNPAKRLNAALAQSASHYQRVGYTLEIKSAGHPTLQLVRKGFTAEYRVDGKVSLVLGPLSVLHHVEQIGDAQLAAAIRAAGHSWLRHSQFTPRGLPELLMSSGLNRLGSVTVTVRDSGTRSVFTVKPRRGSGSTLTITTKRSGTSTLVTSLTRVDPNNSKIVALSRASGMKQPPVLRSVRTTTAFAIRNAMAATNPVPADVLDLRTRGDLIDPSRYQQPRLDELAREILFSANRNAEAVNRTVTGVELNAVLANYHPHEYPGLGLVAVEGRLEMTVYEFAGPVVYCAQLVRFDYTTESLLLDSGNC